MAAKATSYEIAGRATVPRVLVLLASSGPFAVLRRVGAIVVDAIQRVLGRRLTAHISQEVLERVHPAVADDNTSASIVGERGVLRVIATLLHGTPGVVFHRGFVGAIDAPLAMSRRFVDPGRTVPS